VAELEDWKERFLLAEENALRARPKDEEALKDEQIKKLKQKIGDLVMDIDILKEAVKRHLRCRDVRAVKQALPGSSVRRICRLLHVARSSWDLAQESGPQPAGLLRAGGMLQVLIRENPTYGYRRLWALLRNRLGIRANRKRIYRILKAKRWLVHQRVVSLGPE